MTPVASSFIKGAGAYKGKLLLEFHHDPGNIWGFDVKGQGSEFFRELMNSGSKGGWVWDEILGKPSEYGMAKGKFFAFENQAGETQFYTTKGAQFVHKYSRPAKFTYNPVGYLTNQEQYNVQSEIWKDWKESIVEPPKSREPISQRKLAKVQRERLKNFNDLQTELRRKYPKTGDFWKLPREDSFEDLEKWVKEYTGATTQNEILEIVFRIINSRKKKKKEIGSPKQWKKEWKQIGKEFEKRRSTRKSAFQSRTTSTEEVMNYERFGKFHKQDFTLQKVATIQKNVSTLSLDTFTQITTDSLKDDFIIFRGAIARDGPYDYYDKGKRTTLYKDIHNLADIYSRYDYLPLRTSETNSHHAKELGYATNFTLNKDTHEIEADLVLVNDEDFRDIIDKKKEYYVSPGYNDIVENGVQIITDVDHVALSLGNEMARACTGMNEKGASCTKVKPMEVSS